VLLDELAEREELQHPRVQVRRDSGDGIRQRVQNPPHRRAVFKK
jgi:hypothetical protein